MSEEVWMPIDGFGGLYEVSNQGRVRSLDRVIVDTQGKTKPCHGRLIKGTTQVTGGYHMVCLWRDNKQHARRVHVLVLTAFSGPRPEKHDACHNDGNRANNSSSNLRWATRKENMADAVRHGTTTKGWNWKMGTPWVGRGVHG